MRDARRIAVVVGGGSGIGAAAAIELAAHGFVLAVGDVNREAAAAVAAGCAGVGHEAFALDVESETSVADAFAAVEHRNGPIAVLVIAAGIPGLVDDKRPTLRATSLDLWDKVMSVNARGAFLCLREMLRHRELRPVPDSRIIVVASMAAQVLSVNSPPAYVASKGALLALTRVAAGEAARLGVTVNAVAPGAIDTPMLRATMPADRDADYFGNSIAKRVGTAAEVANAIAFLASVKSSYINGACIDVNGGLAMR